MICVGVMPVALAVLPALEVLPVLAALPTLEVALPEPETVVDELLDFEELPHAAASSPNVTTAIAALNHACFIVIPPTQNHPKEQGYTLTAPRRRCESRFSSTSLPYDRRPDVAGCRLKGTWWTVEPPGRRSTPLLGQVEPMIVAATQSATDDATSMGSEPKKA